MDKLPTEIIAETMLQMDLKSLYNFCKTSKNIKKTCKYLVKNKKYKNDLAKAILKNEFGYTKFPNNISSYSPILVKVNNTLQDLDYKSQTFEENNNYVYEASIGSGDLKLLKFTIANGIEFDMEDILSLFINAYEDSINDKSDYNYCDILSYLLENDLREFLLSTDLNWVDNTIISMVVDMTEECGFDVKWIDD